MSSFISFITNGDADGLSNAIQSKNDVTTKLFDDETLLHRAVLVGSVPCAKVLIEKGADVNACTKTLEEPPLHIAVQEGNLELVQLLLLSGADSNICNAEGENAIFVAIRFNHTELITPLINGGCKSDIKNVNGETAREIANILHMDDAFGSLGPAKVQAPTSPKSVQRPNRKRSNNTIDDLVDAVKSDNIDKLRELSESVNILKQQMFDDYTLLHLAAQTNSVKCLEFIIKEKADVNAQTRTFQETPLHIAAEEGNEECIDMLLNAGADPNIENTEGENVLFSAMRSRNINVFERFVKKGVNINSQNISGYTPIQFATMYHLFDMAMMLISHSADVSLGPHNTYVIAYESDEKELATVIKLKDPSLSSKVFSLKQPTIIDSPEKMKKIKSVKGEILNYVIIDNDEELKAHLEDAEDKNALLTAAIGLNSVKCAELLLNEGADINLQEKNFKLSPLMVAIDHEFIETFKILMKHKADINLLDSAGESALFHAIRSSKMDFIVDLINAGADVTIQNKNGETPAIVALQNGNEIALQMITVKDPDALTRNPEFSLFAAIESGKDELFTKAMKTHPDVNTHNSRQYTPFQVATILHRFSMAEQLAAVGADITQGPRNSYSIAVAVNEPLLAVLVKRADPELAKGSGKKKEILEELEQNQKLHSSFGKALTAIISDDPEELGKILREDKSDDFDLNALIHAAAGLDSVKSISVLVNHGANVNFQENNFHETALHIACLHGFISTIKVLIKEGADLSIPNSQGETPLFYAVRENNKDCVQELINAGASPLHLSHNEETPIILARSNNYMDIVKILTNSSKQTVKEPTSKPHRGGRRMQRNKAAEPITSPLAEVIEKDDSLALKEALAKGQNANEKLNSDDVTLLHIAAKEGANKCAKLLICFSADVNAQTKRKETPLHIAIENGHKDIIETLLTKGADFELKNAEGENALFYAIRSKDIEIVRKISSLFSEVSFVNSYGQTPLIVAIETHDKDIVRELISCGANITAEAVAIAKDEKETGLCSILLRANPQVATETMNSYQYEGLSSPPEELFAAIRANNVPAIRKILKDGNIELNAEDLENGIPLFVAIEHNALESVKELVDNGADVNFWAREYPVYMALRLGHKEIADFLIESGADLDAETTDGETAIFAAVKSKQPDLVQTVISKGVNINQTNSCNITPLYVATGMKEHGIVKTLLSSGAKPDSIGLPPLKLANNNHDQKAATLLARYGAHKKSIRPPRTTRAHLNIRSLSPVRRNVKKESFEDGRCCICNRRNNLLKLLPCGHRPICRNCLNSYIAHKSTCPVCQMSFYATK